MIVSVPIALDTEVRRTSVENLEQQVWFVGEHLADGPRSPREE
jgi:hypothetical protein